MYKLLVGPGVKGLNINQRFSVVLRGGGIERNQKREMSYWQPNNNEIKSNNQKVKQHRPNNFMF